MIHFALLSPIRALQPTICLSAALVRLIIVSTIFLIHLQKDILFFSLLPLPSSARPHFFLDAPPIGQVYQNPVVAGSSLISKNASFLSAPLISNARLKVRTGYFGLCISTDNSGWICNRDIATLKKSIIATRLI